jgi:hypothetical protein
VCLPVDLELQPSANANKFNHIKCINILLGLFVPLLVIPLEMPGESADHER